jgi:two-component system, NtrC family, response regulator AtoC
MKILIIDDEQLIRWSLEKHYSSLGYKVYTAETGEDGIKQFSLYSPDVVFVDNKLPKMQGLEVISKLKSINEEAMIVFMTAYGSIETAVKAIKLGASEYVNKPFSFHEIDIVIEDIRNKLQMNSELQLLRRQQKETVTFDQIIAESPKIREIIQLAKKIASTDTTTILLLGESGTGKDLFARAIHNASSRKDKPFVTINCSSLPDTLLESELFGHEQGAFTDAKKLKKGFFEIAEGGTVFLDEIGEINATTQVKLLSVLENRTVRRLGGTSDIPIEIRIIAATNKDLKKSVDEKEFREDLYYRLKVFQITLPPLRDHKEDIPLLAKLFLYQFNTQFRKSISTIENTAIEVLISYKWPGNVRELRNVIERAVILESNSVLHAENLPGEINILSDELIQSTINSGAVHAITTKPGLDDPAASLYDMEKQAIINALEKVRYNQTKASRLLGITRDTLRYKMKKYSLKSKLG